MILFNPQRPTHVTSIARVTALDSFRFGPGAIADHLISAGDVLFGKGQMGIAMARGRRHEKLRRHGGAVQLPGKISGSRYRHRRLFAR